MKEGGRERRGRGWERSKGGKGERVRGREGREDGSKGRGELEGREGGEGGRWRERRKGFTPTNEGVGYGHFQPCSVFHLKTRVFNRHRLDNTVHWCLHVELDQVSWKKGGRRRKEKKGRV